MTPVEPWLDKRELAEHLSCSVRSIESALAEGLPHAVIFGRVKFKVSQIEPWLERRGHLRLCGDYDQATSTGGMDPEPDCRQRGSGRV